MMRYLSASLMAGTLLVVGTSCSALPAPEAGSSNESISQACQIIVSELKTTGLSLYDLVPADPTKVDSQTLADAYTVGAGTLERARGQVSDVKVGDIIDTAAGSMAELAPIFEVGFSAGDPGALLKAGQPLARLGGIAAQCSTVVLK